MEQMNEAIRIAHDNARMGREAMEMVRTLLKRVEELEAENAKLKEKCCD